MGSQASDWWFICLFIFHLILQVNCRCDKIVGEQNKVIVNTTLGLLKGANTTVYDEFWKKIYFVKEFLGVPYAKPPKGDLRFRRPVKVEPWNTTRKFLCMPRPCVQSTSNIYPWRLSRPADMGEDCLYMNIWVPHNASSRAKKSILFFIHGGGITNSTGSASDPIYHGRTLSGVGNIIVVVPNYRIGTLGFWTSSTHKVISSHSRAPGNVGIWDLIMALKWVVEHIENFGGDTKKITLAGQGLGSVIVSLLSISPRAQGLYRRQIMQSGSAMWQHNKYLTYNFDISQKIAEKVGCASNTSNLFNDEDKVINCMQRKEAFELATAEEQTEGFYPVWGDELFENNPREEIMEHKFIFRELFIGFSGNEGVPLLLETYPQVFGYFGNKTIALDSNKGKYWINRIIQERFPYYNFNETYQPLSRGPGRIGYDKRFVLADAFGDQTVTCPTIYYAQEAAKAGANVYLYHFDLRPKLSKWGDWAWATHFDEVDFIFGGPFLTIYREWWQKMNETKEERKFQFEPRFLSRQMILYWAGFVRAGIPPYSYDPFDPCNCNEVMTFYSTSFDFPAKVQIPDLSKRCEFWLNKY